MGRFIYYNKQVVEVDTGSNTVSLIDGTSSTACTTYVTRQALFSAKKLGYDEAIRKKEALIVQAKKELADLMADYKLLLKQERKG